MGIMTVSSCAKLGPRNAGNTLRAVIMGHRQQGQGPCLHTGHWQGWRSRLQGSTSRHQSGPRGFSVLSENRAPRWGAAVGSAEGGLGESVNLLRLGEVSPNRPECAVESV